MSDRRLGRFAFLKLVVRNLQQEVSFYRSVIGYGEGLYMEGEIAGRPVEEILLSAPNGQPEMLILAYKDGEAPPSPNGVITGVFTPDIEAFERRVVAAGGKIFQPIGSIEMSAGTSRLAFYTDPEGYLLEVIEG